MKDFSYYKPSTVSEAVTLLAAGGENRALSGGMTLLPTMKMRLASPTAIVDLAALPGLAAITVDGGNVTIGAMTTHADVAASAAVKAAIPALASLAGLIGDPQVRHRGTIGGSMANADPSADYPAAAVGLGATIVTDRREISADGFFTAMFQTALEPDEIILAVRFPIPDAAGYAKFRRVRHRVSRWLAPSWRVSAVPYASRLPGLVRSYFDPETLRMRWRPTFRPTRWRGFRLRRQD